MPVYRVEGAPPIVYRSESIKKVIGLAEKVAPYKSTVLITGESGTGKDLFARVIHQLSPRAKGPFVVINCGAIPPTLIESELFGHTKGSFTGAHESRIGHFERANRGTIVLDEISELSLDLQVKILRVIETGEILRIGGRDPITLDVRIIAASNKPLDRAVEEGRFREDLYYRLNVVSIMIPPLRERPEDIEELAFYFLDRFSKKLGKRATRFSNGAMVMLKSYDWPGNVRELRNVIERSLVVAKGPHIGAEELSFPFTPKPEPQAADEQALSLSELEKQHIRRVLEMTDWNVSQAAKILGIERATLYSKMKRYGLKKS